MRWPSVPARSRRRAAFVVASVVALLAVAGCGGGDDDGGGGSAVDAERWTGTFDSTFGELTFEADGDQVTGTYEYCGGTLEGTASGDELSGEWSEDPDACAPGESRAGDEAFSGTFDFTLASDDASFAGTWKYASGGTDPQGDAWEGTRISDGASS